MLSSAEPVPRERLSRDCSLSQQTQSQNKPSKPVLTITCVDMIQNVSTKFTLLNILKQGRKIWTNYGLPYWLCAPSAVTHHYYLAHVLPLSSTEVNHFNHSDSVGVYLWKWCPLTSWDGPATTTEKGRVSYNCYISSSLRCTWPNSQNVQFRSKQSTQTPSQSTSHSANANRDFPHLTFSPSWLLS